MIKTNSNDDFEYSCTICDKQIDKDDKFCKNCGSDLSEIVYEDEKQTTFHCETCGIEVQNDYKFCKNCGTKIIKEKLCSKCNRSFIIDGDYCPNCGNKFLPQ